MPAIPNHHSADNRPAAALTGVLLSGGLDSCILVAEILRRGCEVQPFYIRTGVRWEAAELQAVRRFLEHLAGPRLRKLVVLDLPLTDLYASHWSLTGNDVPNADSADQAVYLPGRNALLLVKPMVWCQLHRIPQLALAPLGTSPFEDSRQPFLDAFESALNQGCEFPVKILRPFGEMTKRQVMDLGRELPLELTFSCISPISGLHCGRCNKCAERQAAIRDLGCADRTNYAFASARKDESPHRSSPRK